jgi:hypothetical protein
MAQSDQVVQDATFPSVRADINDNLAALFSQSSGNSAPTVTVAFQPWVDTSSSPPVWKVRNGSNTAWITVGVLDPAGFNAGGVTAIANGGTGAITAALALAALLPSQGGNAGKALVTSGSAATWGTVASGASIQVFTASGTYTPTAGKTTFLAFATGGGGGGLTASGNGGDLGFGAGAGGTAARLYNTTELGASASVTIGGGGAGVNFTASGVAATGGNGTNTTCAPIGTGLTITGNGGGGAQWNAAAQWFSAGVGGGTSNSVIAIDGGGGAKGAGGGGVSFFAGGRGRGGPGGNGGAASANGTAGVVFILEW